MKKEKNNNSLKTLLLTGLLQASKYRIFNSFMTEASTLYKKLNGLVSI